MTCTNVEQTNVAQTLLSALPFSPRTPRKQECLRHVYLLLLLVIGPSVFADPVLFRDAQFKVRVTSDIVYGTGAVRGGSKDLLLDLYEPEPPLCIIHGTNDTLVPVAAATELAERARKVGLPHEIHLLEGRNNGHITYFTREIDGVTLLQKTIDFFYRHLDLARR